MLNNLIDRVFLDSSVRNFIGDLEWAQAVSALQYYKGEASEPKIATVLNGETFHLLVDEKYLLSHHLVTPDLVPLPYEDRYQQDREDVEYKLAQKLAPEGSSWRHYSRPGAFEVVAVCRNHDDRVPMVVFHNTQTPHELWVRPVTEFFERLESHNGRYWRFERQG